MMAVNTESQPGPETTALARTVVDEIPGRVADWEKDQVCRFATSVAHEINNPLAAVLGNVDMALEMLQEGSVDLTELQGMLRDLRGAADRVREIVQSMKLLAREDTAAEQPPRSEQQRPSGFVSSAARPRVLVVDDEPTITGLLSRALGSESYEVTTVEGGRAALAALAGDPFDVVLCDLMMPEMTGEDVYREATRRWPQLASRFVFMTGGAITPRGQRFLACVPASVLKKPFRIKELLGCLSKRSRPSRTALAQRPAGTGAG